MGPFEDGSWDAFVKTTHANIERYKATAFTQLSGAAAAADTVLADAVWRVMADQMTGQLRPLTGQHRQCDDIPRGQRAALVASAQETLRLASGKEPEPGTSMPTTATSKAAEYRSKMPTLGGAGSPASEADLPKEVPLEAAMWDMRAAASGADSVEDLAAVIRKAEHFEAHWGEDKFKNGTSWRGAKRRGKCGVAVPGSAAQTWRDLTPIREKLAGKVAGSAERTAAIAAIQKELDECDGGTFNKRRRALVSKWAGEKGGNEAAIAKSKAAGSKQKNRKKKQKTSNDGGSD